MMYSGTCRAEPGVVQAFRPGMSSANSRKKPPKASQALGECIASSRVRNFSMLEVRRGATLGGEHALGTPLDEEDQDHEQHDLSEHRARQRLEELVGDTEADGAGDRACDVTHATQHDHHEAVDDVALAQLRTDVAELREC